MFFKMKWKDVLYQSFLSSRIFVNVKGFTETRKHIFD